MKNYNNFFVKSIVCVLLSASACAASGIDADDGFSVPRRSARIARQSFIKALRQGGLSSLPEGTTICFCDIEADPRKWGPITEISIIKITKGIEGSESLHYYLNPKTKVSPFVSKVHPIDPSQQPTFEKVAQVIYEFIRDTVLVSYGSFDARKLSELFGTVKPYGKTFIFYYKNFLDSVRRANKRAIGELKTFNSPPPKEISVVSESPTPLIAEHEAKKLAAGTKRSSKRGVKRSLFSQEAVAETLGATENSAKKLCISPKKTYNLHKIPKEHRKRHHAMADTLELAGIQAVIQNP